MAPSGLDAERAIRLAALTEEFRPLLATGTEMSAIQSMLSARGVGVMDSIIVTRELLGAGPGDLGRAKTLVLATPPRNAEREQHHALVDELLVALDEVDQA
ncbi:hypothetical protein ABZS61_23180 [Streptomyces sp. NPDC005566]|uniref:hypothetical protein n=1 Tax=Streptomyces sp. NPDC005566 TaxID=3156886 RepID=UPI0033AAA463